MPVRPNETETAVHAYHWLGDMAMQLGTVIFSLYIRYGLDSFIILDLLFYYYFNGTCKAHLNIFI